MTALRQLLRDREGSAALEFSIVAPAFLVMLLGVFQVGIWMQSYNAMRNAVNETSRSVAVEFQTDNILTNSQIEDTGLAIASTSPYMLDAESAEVEVIQPVTQPFTEARLLTLRLTYRMPSFLSFAGVSGPEVTYSRDMYLALE